MKPILFNTEMVRAILDNRKTVTRRPIKPQPLTNYYELYLKDLQNGIAKLGWRNSDGVCFRKAPYQPGDVLYVRETWQRIGAIDEEKAQIIEETEQYIYAADDDSYLYGDIFVMPDGTLKDHIPWRSSIHMPKEAARIFLRVTDVRVERLQDIGYDDLETDSGFFATTEQFASLWDKVIKKSDLDKYGWEANPWVWVIEFERCEKPEKE